MDRGAPVGTPTERLMDAVVLAIMERIDVDALTDTLVDQIAEKLLGSIKLSDFAATFATKHGPEVHDRLGDALLGRLLKRAQ